MEVDPLLRDALVRGSAWLSFACYILALACWLRHSSSSLVRWFWTLGCLIFLIHVALAFRLVHQWSHQQAFEATKLQGGVGEGIYFNYLVIAVWLADVLWWWFKKPGYEHRSRWITWFVQGFLLFMWFNAAVVFAHDYLWIVGLSGFGLLAVVTARRSQRS